MIIARYAPFNVIAGSRCACSGRVNAAGRVGSFMWRHRKMLKIAGSERSLVLVLLNRSLNLVGQADLGTTL